MHELSTLKTPDQPLIGSLTMQEVTVLNFLYDFTARTDRVPLTKLQIFWHDFAWGSQKGDRKDLDGLLDSLYNKGIIYLGEQATELTLHTLETRHFVQLRVRLLYVMKEIEGKRYVFPTVIDSSAGTANAPIANYPIFELS